MYKQSGFSKIINILILIDEGVKMVGYTWNFAVIIASMECHLKPLSYYTGPTFCNLSYFMALVAVNSNIACGVGIAFLRQDIKCLLIHFVESNSAILDINAVKIKAIDFKICY